MTNPDIEKNEQTEGCCPPDGQTPDTTSADCCAPAPKGKRWDKTVIFVLIILVALVATAYSVKRIGDAGTVYCGMMISSIDTLNQVAAGTDAVVLFLAGEDKKLATSAVSSVDEAIVKLDADQKKAMALTLKPKTADYERAIADFSITEFPAAIVMGAGCGADLLTGTNLTADNIVNSYTKLLAKSCNPAKCNKPCGRSN